jgi:lysylphosphatidylglycerol synthetase-like protein (DUF2156 family)
MMKRRIQMILASIGVIAAALLPVTVPSAAYAVDPGFGACSGNSTSAVCRARNNDNVFRILKNVINILLTVVGIVAVIMVVVGGIKYAASQGDQGAVSSAKNTIIYAIVGLVIAVMAFAIVNFVLIRI